MKYNAQAPGSLPVYSDPLATAEGAWTDMDSDITSKLKDYERYAALTIMSVFPPENYQKDQDELSHDWQSAGAQFVNHLANRMVLALFAPSRPFFRLDPDDEITALAEEQGIDKDKLQEVLALGERKAVRELDKKASRPKLFQAIKLLQITGNALLDMTGEHLRAMSLRYYRVRRDIYGRVMRLVIREQLRFDELDAKVQAAYPTLNRGTDKVNYYRDIRRLPSGKYEMCQWIDSTKLDSSYDSVWSEEDFPYAALTWNLADEANYGTGLVEEYVGDFEALSELSEAQINGAILASEFRWLANPAGMTRPEDFKTSSNGDCLPGQEGDLSLVQAAREVAAALDVQLKIATQYINRLGRAFLVGAAVTRDAERVTAEEIRMVANELESSLGGVYSRIAVDMQLPMARWLLARVNLKLDTKKIEPVIITGLDALSRNADLENLKLWLQDMVTMSQIPPQFLARLNTGAIAAALAAPRGINSAQYLLSDDQVRAQNQEAIQTQATAAGAVAQAEAGAQPQGPAQ